MFHNADCFMNVDFLLCGSTVHVLWTKIFVKIG